MQAVIENKSTSKLFEETEKTAQNNIDEYISIVKELVAQKKYSVAEEFLLIAKDKFNEDARLLYNLGIVLIALKRIEEANDYLRRAVEGGYITNKSLTSYALTEKALGNEEKALELFQKASELDRKRVLPRIRLFAELFEQNKYYRAAELLDELQSEYPEGYALYHAEYITLVEAKEYEKAYKKLESIKEKYKDNFIYIYDYVSLLHSMQKYDEAWKCFQNNEEVLSTEEKLSLVLKAKIVSALKMKNEALDSYIQLYKKYNLNFAAFNTAILMLMDENIEKADEYLSKVIEKEDNDLITYAAYYLHAKCLAFMNAEEDIVREAYKTAVDIFEEAYEKDAYGVLAMEFAVECYGYLGDIEKQQICKGRMKQFKEAITNRNKNI